ncbi:MAG: hypothetical protein EOM80_10710 [Erysipelotrichia bacterium]|nr:nucleoside-triphosphatase [Candidatus Riflebacteria bacterium]NCB39232.1 hypothetical protein [Erysipelotrichia bacterium]
MIYLLTGPINSGKTSWILRDFQHHPKADGFACKKTWLDGQHIGYDLLHLPTGTTCPFIRTPDHIPPDWKEATRLSERFSFSSAGLVFAHQIAQNAILKRAEKFYLDEVGPLELRGDGFCNILRALIEAQIDLVVVIRESLIDQITAAFEIKEYTILNQTPTKSG